VVEFDHFRKCYVLDHGRVPQQIICFSHRPLPRAWDVGQVHQGLRLRNGIKFNLQVAVI
jgi:hypothetical protein